MKPSPSRGTTDQVNRPYSTQDLSHVLETSPSLKKGLAHSRIFVTGGTGFFGRWLIESWKYASQELGVKTEMVVLTRSARSFLDANPHLKTDALSFVEGDIRAFAFPRGEFTHVIHAATPASAQLNQDAPQEMFDTVVEGTRRALAMAAQAKAHTFLLTSSGAVYGPQPSELTHIPEEYGGGPDPLNPASAYAEGKRAAEHLCRLARGTSCKIARGFAFVGPGLPLDIHFAVGNFLRDGMAGGPIRVGGDGRPYRSYLYSADLAAWLWEILFAAPANRAFNVGSDDDMTIAELAGRIAKRFGTQAEIAKKPQGAPPTRYVPSVERAKQELGLKVHIPFDEAIERTIRWHQGANA